MGKFLIGFYLFTFGIYVWFSRVPDWFESDIIAAEVRVVDNSAVAFYTVKKQEYMLPVRGKTAGETVQIIYNPSKPTEAKAYGFFSYWIDWKEVLISLGILFVGHFAAESIVANPAKQNDEGDNETT